jgi:nicotinamidase/pyrazinamidase
MDVFVDVDVQVDFCEPTGALHVPGAPIEAFRRLTEIAVQRRIPILGSVDSHAFDAWEFASSGKGGPNGERPGFPDHCVKGTPGWLKVSGTLPSRFRFVPNLGGVEAAPLAAELTSGRMQALHFEKEVYSLFANPNAEAVVAALGAAFDEPRFVVYGVATDYCIKAAALGLRERGHATAVVVDAIAGITPEGVETAILEMRAAGVTTLRLADLA